VPLPFLAYFFAREGGDFAVPMPHSSFEAHGALPTVLRSRISKGTHPSPTCIFKRAGHAGNHLALQKARSACM
jgi:hypothetical protein